MRTIIILLTLIIRSFGLSAQPVCDLTNLLQGFQVYGPGTHNNIDGYPLLYLCSGSIVYDTISSFDRTVIIEPGADFRWKVCGPAFSEIFVKSGGKLTYLEVFCPTARAVMVEPGAILTGPNVMSGVDTCQSIILPPMGCATGVQTEQSLYPIVTVTPNPNSGNATIQLGFQIQSQTEVILLDLFGRVVYKEHLDLQSHILHFDGVQKGCYLLKVTDKNGPIYSTRIIRE